MGKGEETELFKIGRRFQQSNNLPLHTYKNMEINEPFSPSSFVKLSQLLYTFLQCLLIPAAEQAANMTFQGSYRRENLQQA